MKKILSLVLVLVMLLGCLGMTASATNPADYPPIDTVSIGGYLAALNVSSDNVISFTVRIPNAGSTVSNAAVIIDPSNATNGLTAATVAGTTLTQDSTTGNWTGTIPSLSTNSSSTIVMTFGGTTHTYTLNVIAGTGQAELSALRATAFYDPNHLNDYTVNAKVTFGSISVGGVTRYTASVQLPNGTSASALTSLELKAIGLNSSSTFELDGNTITGDTFTANFTAQTHTLTVHDGNDSRDYLLSACAPDANGKITVYIGIRTWQVIAYNHNTHPHYTYPSHSVSNTLDAKALAIDSIGGNATDIQPSSYQHPQYSSSIWRPVFTGTTTNPNADYVEIDVMAGSSVRDVLDQYATSVNMTVGGSSSYVQSLTKNGKTLNWNACGSAGGWMYLVRYSTTDVDTDLPNIAANNYIVTGGQYIDWIYTAAYGADFGYSMW